MADAAKDVRCTTCHAPFAALPPERLAPTAKIEEGVSCESCHGPAENWLRSHTRPDYTRAQRVASGMRDLEDLYLRANTCVACHQAIAPELVAAGHPRLHFELESHQEREPRHWKEIWGGPQAWVVGQIVALREMSHHRQGSTDAGLRADWEATYWLLREVLDGGEGGLVLPVVEGKGPGAEFVKACDRLAQQASALEWKEVRSRALGRRFGQLAGALAEKKVWTGEDAARWRKLAAGMAAVVPGLPGGTEAPVREALQRLQKPLEAGKPGPRATLGEDLRVVLENAEKLKN